MSSVVSLRMRVMPRFPARISGTNGITVVREDADLVVKPDTGALAPILTVDAPTTTFFTVWRQDQDAYYKIEFQDLVDNIGDVIIGDTLVSINGVPSAANKGLYFTAPETAAVYDLSAFTRGISGSADAAAFRTGLELTDAATATTGAAGLAILADATTADVRDYLDVPPYVADRTALKALDTTKDTVVYLKEAGREGIFRWTTGNFSTHIAADTREGIYIKADGIAATAGSWVRFYAGEINNYWFGTIGDGVTGDSTALQAFFDMCAFEKTAGRWSAGKYLFNAQVVIDEAVQITCDGYNVAPSPDMGTWIVITSTGFVPIRITSLAARGTRFSGGLAAYQTHAAAGGGWTPTNYPEVIRIENTEGEVTIDDIYLCGINKGIFATNAGRVLIGTLRGQWFNYGLELDEILDVCRVEDMHAWIYYSSHNSIVQYNQANADCIVLNRVDIPFFDKLFSYGFKSTIRCKNGATGTANKVEIDTLMADFTKFGIYVDDDADNVTADIAIFQVQQEKYPQSGLGAITGSSALRVGGDNARIQIANFRSEVTGKNAIRLDGINNRVDIGNFRAASWNGDADASACFHLANSGGGINMVTLANTPLFNRTGSEPIKNGSTNGVVYRNGAGQTGLLEGIWSEYDLTNNRLIQRPDGISSTISQGIASKGTGTDVRLMPEGYNALRADKTSDANTSILARAALDTFRWLAEGPGTNVNIEFVPKSGGVIIITNIRNFASDAAAAAASPPVPIGGVYRNGSVLQIRVT